MHEAANATYGATSLPERQRPLATAGPLNRSMYVREPLPSLPTR